MNTTEQTMLDHNSVFHNQTRRPFMRVVMREWAMLFRDSLQAARSHHDSNPQRAEFWYLRAGAQLHEAIKARDKTLPTLKL